MVYFRYLSRLLLLCRCCINISATTTTEDETENNNDGVVIYSEENHKGSSILLKEGLYLINEIHQPIKSFKIISNKLTARDSNVSTNTNYNTVPDSSYTSSMTNNSTDIAHASNDANNTPFIASLPFMAPQYGVIFISLFDIDNDDNQRQDPMLDDILNLNNIISNNEKVINNNFASNDNNISENKITYSIDNINVFPYKYIIVYKLNNDFDIINQDTYDPNTGQYFGSNITKMKEIQEKDKLTDITIYNSPDFQGLPDLTQYKNLQNIRVLCNVFKGKSRVFIIENEYKRIIDYIDKVHPLTIIEIQDTSNNSEDKTLEYHETRNNKFFGFNLETFPNPSTEITEMHLINCGKLSSIDFSKYKKLKKVYMYGNTFEKATNDQWNTMIKQIFTLALNTFKEETTGVLFFKKTTKTTITAPLTHVQLPRTFTGEVPKVGETVNSQIQYFSALGATSVAQDAFINSTKLAELNLPKVKTIKQGAFHGNSALKIVNIPEVENIVKLAFQYSHSLTKVGDVKNIRGDNGIFIPHVKTIGSGAFMADGNAQNIIITSIILPECERIEDNAFVRYRKVQTISIPKCKFIGEVAFYDPYALKELEATLVETIDPRAFQFASTPIRSFRIVNGKKEVDSFLELPNCKTIKDQAFWGDKSHNIRGTGIVKLPKATSVADNAFKAAYLESLEAPNLSNSTKILSTSKST